jgi:hypothetical protein
MPPTNYLVEIINPENVNGPKIKAIFAHDFYLQLYKHSPVKYQNLETARFVLQKPLRIFSGVRQFNDGGWCFTGKPKMWYVKEDVRVTFPEHLVFAVYLNAAFNLYEARAERCANDDKLCPDDWQNRYKALVWKSTS